MIYVPVGHACWFVDGYFESFISHKYDKRFSTLHRLILGDKWTWTVSAVNILISQADTLQVMKTWAGAGNRARAQACGDCHEELGIWSWGTKLNFFSQTHSFVVCSGIRLGTASMHHNRSIGWPTPQFWYWYFVHMTLSNLLCTRPKLSSPHSRYTLHSGASTRFPLLTKVMGYWN